MKIPKIADSMGYLEDDLISEAVTYKSDANIVSIRRKKRFTVILVAAMLVLVLMGAGVITAVYGDSIHSWFRHYWKEITGKPMSSKQDAVIERLTQQIGLDETCDGITVTVDSATVGDDNFYILLRVKGVTISERHHYGFEKLEFTMIPEPLEGGGLGGYGLDYLGTDSDGAALFLLDFEYSNVHGFERDTSALQVELRLADFGKNIYTPKKKIISKGEWSFTFEIDRSQPLQTISIPDTEVNVYSYRLKNECTMLLTDIELTNTGIRFHHEHNEMSANFSTELELLMKNGTRVGNSGGVGAIIEGTDILANSYQWLVPVDLEEVEAVKIGESVISIEKLYEAE